MKKSLLHSILLFFALLLLNYVANKVNFRMDLTKDKRYTLSETTKNIVDNISENSILIKVFLEGDFPSEFKRIQTETKQLLNQLKNVNSKINYRFVNPQGMEKQLLKNGLQPSRLSIQEGSKISEIIIFPYATITYKDKVEVVPLLINKQFNSQEEQLQASIENLEYVFADAIYKATKISKKNIAILRGNDELDFIYLDGLLKTLSQYYHLEPFPLDSANVIPQKTLKLLNKFDLAIVAKPLKKFSDNEKFCLDQFQMNGGKTLFTIDNVIAEQDSLMRTGATMALNRELGLTDLLFQYGVRVKYNLVKDLYSSTIKLANGNVGGQTQYKDYLWHYFPLVNMSNTHAITKNILPVSLKYTSSMDILKTDYKNTILLQSSKLSKPYGVPMIITLDEVGAKPKPSDYNKGNQVLGVLVEGDFESAYKGRTKPFETKLYKEKGKNNKMLVIADGDIIRNDIRQGEPMELGIDKWTGQHYGNKQFLQNAIDYLLDDTGLLQLRSKTLQIQFLDKEKAYKNRVFWQTITVVLPLLLLGIFGFIFIYLRKRKYS